MTVLTQHEPGMFSWADLTTPDLAAAKAFYAALFRWTYEDDVAGVDASYAAAKVGKESAAALLLQEREETKDGIPAHWNCYFTVKDVNAAAKRVRKAGGQLFCPPFDVDDSGRMCIFGEPAEAVAALWQANRQIGSTLAGHHGTLCWAELMSRDVDASLNFLVGLFSYQVDRMPLPGADDYVVLKVGEQPACGLVEMPESMSEDMPSLWVPYFDVDDCDASLKVAVALGAKALSAVTSVDSVGRFVMLSDPHGAIFSLMTPEQRGS